MLQASPLPPFSRFRGIMPDVFLGASGGILGVANGPLLKVHGVFWSLPGSMVFAACLHRSIPCDGGLKLRQRGGELLRSKALRPSGAHDREVKLGAEWSCNRSAKPVLTP